MRERTTAIQSMERTMKTPEMSDRDSIAEVARFWDTHDLTDSEDELEEIDEPVFERLPEPTVMMRLPAEEVEAVHTT
jgi:hypothetical protein